MTRHVLAALLLLAALAPAQRTWIVDNVNPVGADFTDLPPAVAAASHGDTILIRGNIGGFSSTDVDKAVHIASTLAGGGVGFRGDLKIHGIPAGMRCSLQAVMSVVINRRMSIDIHDNPGSVVLDRMDGDIRRISNSGQVAIRIGTSGPIEITSSSVTLQDTNVYGGGGSSSMPWAIKLTGSNLTVVDSWIEGGWATWLPYPSCQVISPATPGIVSIDSNIVVTGVTGRMPVGGLMIDPPLACNFNYQAPGIDATRGTVTLHAGMPYATKVVGTATVRTTYSPPLLLTTEFYTTIARSVRLSVPGPAGSLVAILASAPMPPVETGIGMLWLDPSHLLTVAAAQIDSTGIYSLTTSLGPNIPTGFPVMFQALMLTPKPELLLSSPAVRMATTWWKL